MKYFSIFSSLNRSGTWYLLTHSYLKIVLLIIFFKDPQYILKHFKTNLEDNKSKLGLPSLSHHKNISFSFRQAWIDTFQPFTNYLWHFKSFTHNVLVYNSARFFQYLLFSVVNVKCLYVNTKSNINICM